MYLAQQIEAQHIPVKGDTHEQVLQNLGTACSDHMIVWSCNERHRNTVPTCLHRGICRYTWAPSVIPCNLLSANDNKNEEENIGIGKLSFMSLLRWV